ncbi:MAG: SoxR reducing system RseC family protein [candidate division WOR-3 bacterium]
MREKGIVAEIRGGKAKVILSYNPDICKSCSARLFCGINPRGTEGFVWARFRDEPKPGQVVEVEIPEAKAILLSGVMFIVPITIYILSFWLIHLFVKSTGISALLATLPVLAYYPLIANLSGFFSPTILNQ